MKKSLLILILLSALQGFSQDNGKTFTRKDSLRGTLTPLRTCYDINYYHLDMKLDIDKRFISGSNLFRFTAVNKFKRLQFDLFENLKVEKVVFHGKELDFQREFNAVFITFPETIKKGKKEEFEVFYSGNPTIAKNAPWDGGFVFAHDKNGKPWVATACQGFGASSWWPTKDHQYDEVDSMLISISVPDGLMDVSNGRLRSADKLPGGYTRYNWFVGNPINNYTVALNVADYAHFTDNFNGEKGPLSLDYYVLKENLEKAVPHFNADVKPMLKSFEHWFGPYPFYKDGYKLVETPHLGMEHQSAVAYGNKYLKGYLGRDLSGTGLGLTWDFIIVHESGHEWFGNNITSKDIADMWIHESFTNYSESLFIEDKSGKADGATYIRGLRKIILNDAPVIGPYGVNAEGSADMYCKGANMLHTVRTIIDDDARWRSILRGLNTEFALKTVTAADIVKYINKRSGRDLTKVFDQYLRYKNPPLLEVRKLADGFEARWACDVKNFDMPVEVDRGSGKYEKLKLTDNWQAFRSSAFTVSPDYYIMVSEVK